MVYYILAFAFIVLSEPIGNLIFRFKKNRRRVLQNVLCFAPLFLLSALKSDSVGIDTAAYMTFYERISSGSLFSFSYYGFEPGFVFFGSLASHAGLPFRAFQVMVYLISYALLAITAYYLAGSVSLFAAVIMALGLFFDGLSALRQFMAVCIVCLGLVFLLKAKKLSFGIVRFLIVVLIAACFHKSSLFVLTAIPFLFIKWNWTWVVAFSAANVYIMVFGNQIYQFLIYNFLPNNPYQPVSFDFPGLAIAYEIMFVGSSFLLLPSRIKDRLLLPFSKSPPKSSESFDTVLTYNNGISSCSLSFYLGGVALIALIQSFSVASTVFTRTTWFFIPFVGLFLSSILKHQNNVNLRTLLEVCLFFAFGVYLVYTAWIDSSLNINPYSFL